MVKFSSPALIEESRYQPITVMLQQPRVSILSWLEGEGRLMPGGFEEHYHEDYVEDEPPMDFFEATEEDGYDFEEATIEAE
jgi:hypothetical protein